MMESDVLGWRVSFTFVPLVTSQRGWFPYSKVYLNQK